MALGLENNSKQLSICYIDWSLWFYSTQCECMHSPLSHEMRINDEDR